MYSYIRRYCYSHNNMTSFEIPNGIEIIDEGAFDCCKQLESIIIPDSVTEIGDYAFSECINLKSVTIPKSVKKIGRGAFLACFNLETVIIDDSTEIALTAFDKCPRLADKNGFVIFQNVLHSYVGVDENVIIPDGVTTISDYAFEESGETPLVKSVIIPESVTYIGREAFCGCRNLKNIIIPNSVTTIDSDAFAKSGIEAITIPKSVTNMGNTLFDDCPNLKTATILMDANLGHGLFQRCYNLEKIFLANSLTEIPGWLCYKCCNLKEVSIPDSVTSIKMRAFSGCNNLEKLSCPTDVKLEDEAFLGCKKLADENKFVRINDSICDFVDDRRIKKVTIPSGIRRIEAFTFEGRKALTHVSIPDTVSSISYDAFYGCTNLDKETKEKIASIPKH